MTDLTEDQAEMYSFGIPDEDTIPTPLSPIQKEHAQRDVVALERRVRELEDTVRKQHRTITRLTSIKNHLKHLVSNQAREISSIWTELENKIDRRGD